MLKQILSEVAHAHLRTAAQHKVSGMEADDLKRVIHAQAPVLGRVYTLFASEAAQRARVEQGVRELSRRQLRNLAAPHLPGLATRVLGWLDR
jgi:hypothetical protein